MSAMSIDAAVAKIPEGWRFDLTSDDWPNAPGQWGCQLMGPKFNSLSPSDPEFENHFARANGGCPAEAIENAVLNIRS